MVKGPVHQSAYATTHNLAKYDTHIVDQQGLKVNKLKVILRNECDYDLSPQC